MVTNSTTNQTESHRGSLVVIGTGIRTVGQLTVESIAWIQEAESLLYLIGDPIAEAVINKLNPEHAESLSVFYKEGEDRLNAYNAMINRILESVRSGKKTVAAFYGHPGVFAYPSHESIKRARSEGFSAKMLPGISALDCLFADLGLDPADGGCQTYEATEFLLHVTTVDPGSQLILLQIGVLGDWTYKTERYDTRKMHLLVNKLGRYFPLSHLVTLYEAPYLSGSDPVSKEIPLYSLCNFPVTSAQTLYIPPIGSRIADPEIAPFFMNTKT